MSKTKEKKEKVSKDIFSEAKRKRKEAHEAKLKAKENAKAANEAQTREEFRKFFIKAKKKLKIAADMEGVIWTHIKASGFDKKEKFEDGIKHFGYNIK